MGESRYFLRTNGHPQSARDGESLHRLGVDPYIFKPGGLEHFMQIEKTIKDLLSARLGGTTAAFS